LRPVAFQQSPRFRAMPTVTRKVTICRECEKHCFYFQRQGSEEQQLSAQSQSHKNLARRESIAERVGARRSDCSIFPANASSNTAPVPNSIEQTAGMRPVAFPQNTPMPGCSRKRTTQHAQWLSHAQHYSRHILTVYSKIQPGHVLSASSVCMFQMSARQHACV
jgi:hypothetical protein